MSFNIFRKKNWEAKVKLFLSQSGGTCLAPTSGRPTAPPSAGSAAKRAAPSPRGSWTRPGGTTGRRTGARNSCKW